MKNEIQKLAALFSFIILFSGLLYSQEPHKLRSNGKTFTHEKRKPKPKVDSDCEKSNYRSIDGVCNNLSYSEWGATDISLYRIMTEEYGSTDLLNAMNGESRPSARAISNALCDETETIRSKHNLSAMVFTWGQFLDHDITLTPEDHIEYEPIVLPQDESLFTTDIPFFRSAIHEGTGISDARQQTNLITSWIDASNVYGSDESRANWLRTGQQGKLKMSEGQLLPYNTVTGNKESDIDQDAPSMAGDGGGQVKVFVAGDIRANEQPGLTALHTLFVRLHNKYCDELINDGVKGDDEIYYRARKKVAGVIQSISYNEFLPTLGIKIKLDKKYKPDIQADISNVFATAAFRLGHTMVTEELLVVDNNCNALEEEGVSLVEAFFNPEIVENYNIAPILKGLSTQVQNEIDLYITENLRNFLFADASSGMSFGLDLASLNIQRGRDHGLPDYNSARKKYLGKPVKSFRDITKNVAVQNKLKDLYGNVDNIDLWIGLLAEDHAKNASVGPTLHAILSSQFEKLYVGDRFFFLHDKHLSKREKDQIRKTSLSDVIEQCTELDGLAENVFTTEACSQNTTKRKDISEQQEIINALQIYPNPATTELTIQFGDSFNSEYDKSVRIVNMSGQQVKKFSTTQNTISIELYDVMPGLYLIEVEQNGRRIIQRIVKSSR